MEPNTRSYQPFLIGNGLSKTGLLTYVESWMKPQDAFDTLQNAYVYRGSIHQRDGISLFPSASGDGALVYQDNFIAATGDTTTGPFGSTLSIHPLIGTVTITAQTAAGKRSSTASFAAGDVNWSTGGLNLAISGTINFATGVWTITTSSAIANSVPIVIQYNYVPTNGDTPINNAIMGIVLHQDQATNTQKLFVVDTKRACRWDVSSASFVPLQSFQQIFWVGNGNASVSTTGSVTLQWTNIAPYSISITDGLSTITDIPSNSTTGTFTQSGILNPTNTSVINYTTGVITMTFTATLPSTTSLRITASLQGDYFNGNNTNFFKFTNWQTVDDQPSYLYMTNNIDFVTLFDGIYLARPPFAITYNNTINDDETGAVLYPKVNDFRTCRDIKVYKNRLLFIQPTLLNKTPDGQSIRWSQLGNVAFPLGEFNFVADLVGNGGELSAPTGDWLQTTEFIRDVLVVFAQNSIWIFRYTGNTKDLFRFDKVSGSRSTNAPYGSVEYDTYCTSMGARGLIYCDGVNVDRYDETVIDLIEDINQSVFKQCYAQKYDTLNQTWMLFPTQEGEFTTSNQVLVYNFLEKTWAKFNPRLGNLVQSPDEPNTLSCLGIGSTVGDLTWDDFAEGSRYFSGEGLTWSQATYSWNSFKNQDLSPDLLGGDQNGYVYTMLDGATDNPGGTTDTNGVSTIVKTHKLNPFIQDGQKARFGYLDVYYEVNNEVKATFKFYINNSATPCQSTLFTFDGPANQEYYWKRIYISVVGEFLQIEINSIIGYDDQTNEITYNKAGAFKILGLLLHAGTAGRLTPGMFL